VFVLRALLWAALLIICYRGVAAIIAGTPSPGSGQPGTAGAARAGHRFPVSLAEAYALQFSTDYLGLSPATAAQRARELRNFLAPGSDPQLGWNGAGTLQPQSVQPAGIQVHDAHHATVDMLAQLGGRLEMLGVPVYASGGGLAISGDPALLPAPRTASPAAAPASAPTDAAAQAQLTSQLQPFFRAYASGDRLTLSRFLARGATVTGLGGAVRFSSIAAVSVPPGGALRHITVSVIWELPSGTTGGRSGPSAGSAGSQPVAAAPAQLQMSYGMTVIRQGGSWYVAAIGPAGQPPGPP
jgi:hypothetical protein